MRHEARRIAVNVARLPELLGAVLKAEEAQPQRPGSPRFPQFPRGADVEMRVPKLGKVWAGPEEFNRRLLNLWG